MLQSDEFFDRVCDALGIKKGHGDKTKIAKIAEVSSTAVGLWEKGEMPGRDSLKSIANIAKESNTSIHWLLTGEGVKKLNPSIDEILDQKIREIVREELAKTPQQPKEKTGILMGEATIESKTEEKKVRKTSVK